MQEDYIKGRGSQINTHNPFLKQQYVQEHIEGLDEALDLKTTTKIFYENPKKLINEVKSPDIPAYYSMNPYQGCEHGCIYCYARNSHEYWGFSAGIDFESKIIVKENAPQLLEKEINKKNWQPKAIMLAGNTDCYQPLEKELKITRKILKVLAQYRHPVSIITKNSLIERDLDILKDLARDNLVHVYISITTLDEELRRKMEPRTASAKRKMNTTRLLSDANIPTGVMTAPIIPGLNHSEIPQILKQAGEAGARNAGYTMVRLNGSIAALFKDWLIKNYPDRADKVWHQIQSVHGGEVNDTQYGRRMTGEGAMANSIQQLFQISKKKYLSQIEMPPYDLTKFRKNGVMGLFD